MRILIKIMIGLKSRIKSFVKVLETYVIKKEESREEQFLKIKIAIIVWGIYILMIYIGYKMGYEITDNIAYLESISITSFIEGLIVEEPIKVLLISFQDGVAKTIWLDMYPSDTLNLVKASSMEFARMCITDGSKIVCSIGHGIVDSKDTSDISLIVTKIAQNVEKLSQVGTLEEFIKKVSYFLGMSIITKIIRDIISNW